MLERIRQMGVSDRQVLRALGTADRKLFVAGQWQEQAYENGPLPIGFGQTISQPYTVARMCELLTGRGELRMKSDKVLEIGTGSGWQTCILAKLFKLVYSIEMVPDLARRAESTIRKLHLTNISIKTGDGKRGWVEYAPYNAIICGANADRIPEAWIKQIASGGRIVCPVKGVMTRITKIPGSEYLKTEEFGEYSFVPLV